MAMLGDILAAARRSARGLEQWLSAHHPVLLESIAAASAREGTTIGGFARTAVADFAQYASEQDWATLTSSLRDSGDPGSACLLGMLEWRLAMPIPVASRKDLDDARRE
jgi:hypothetical protein